MIILHHLRGNMTLHISICDHVWHILVDFHNLEMADAWVEDKLRNHNQLVEECIHEEELEGDMVELVCMVGPVTWLLDLDLLQLMILLLRQMIFVEPEM